MQIQVWAPGLDVSSLVNGLVGARLRVLSLADPAEVQALLPLLIVYTDPAEELCARAYQSEEMHYSRILAFLSQVDGLASKWRLVNLSYVALPALVSWCIESCEALPAESRTQFPKPDPLDALLALEWLKEHPGHLQEYQELESHPFAAALERRHPDLDCLARYQQAANINALLAAMQERRALEEELENLAIQLHPLRDQQLEVLALRDQLDLLRMSLRQADAAQERCMELYLSLRAQQLDLELLSRRLVLLEEVVSGGAQSSLRLQHRLTQVLNG